jgi:hypothetical protein
MIATAPAASATPRGSFRPNALSWAAIGPPLRGSVTFVATSPWPGTPSGLATRTTLREISWGHKMTQSRSWASRRRDSGRRTSTRARGHFPGQPQRPRRRSPIRRAQEHFSSQAFREGAKPVGFEARLRRPAEVAANQRRRRFIPNVHGGHTTLTRASLSADDNHPGTIESLRTVSWE